MIVVSTADLTGSSPSLEGSVIHYTNDILLFSYALKFDAQGNSTCRPIAVPFLICQQLSTTVSTSAFIFNITTYPSNNDKRDKTPSKTSCWSPETLSNPRLEFQNEAGISTSSSISQPCSCFSSTASSADGSLIIVLNKQVWENPSPQKTLALQRERGHLI